MKKLHLHGIRYAARQTRNADYRVEHVQIEYDPDTDEINAYLPGPYGYFEPDNERNLVLHIFVPHTMKQLREMVEQAYIRVYKED
jgi:hypothetical protein